MPNNESFNERKEVEFNCLFRSYKSEHAHLPMNSWIVNAELVGVAVAKIEKGKAFGFDCLTVTYK